MAFSLQLPSSFVKLPSEKIVNCGLCVVGGFDQAGIVMFLVKKCVINYFNGDLSKPVFHFNSSSSWNLYAKVVIKCNVRLKTYFN